MPTGERKQQVFVGDAGKALTRRWQLVKHDRGVAILFERKYWPKVSPSAIAADVRCFRAYALPTRKPPCEGVPTQVSPRSYFVSLSELPQGVNIAFHPLRRSAARLDFYCFCDFFRDFAD